MTIFRWEDYDFMQLNLLLSVRPFLSALDHMMEHTMLGLWMSANDISDRILWFKVTLALTLAVQRFLWRRDLTYFLDKIIKIMITSANILFFYHIKSRRQRNRRIKIIYTLIDWNRQNPIINFSDVFNNFRLSNSQ